MNAFVPKYLRYIKPIKLFPISVVLVAVTLLSGMLSACTFTSYPVIDDEIILKATYQTIIIPSYLFEQEGVDYPDDVVSYYILNSKEDIASIPEGQILLPLQEAMAEEVDFTDTTLVFVSVLGMYEEEYPQFTYVLTEDDAKEKILKITWRHGTPIMQAPEDFVDYPQDQVALYQFSIAIKKIPSDTEIKIIQESASSLAAIQPAE